MEQVPLTVIILGTLSTSSLVNVNVNVLRDEL